MSRKLLKVLILAAMLSSALLSAASSAPASIWTSNGSAGGTGFTATAGTTKLTLSGISAGINCTTTSTTGVLYGPTGIVGVNATSDETLTFAGCRAGGLGATAVACCGFLRRIPSGIGRGVGAVAHVARATGSAVYHVTVAAISNCTIVVSASGGSGAFFWNVEYHSGASTVSASGQSITASWTSCGTLFGSASGSAAATFSNSSGGDPVFTVTSAFVPVITL
jgi:hypothetical protein